MLRAVRLLLLPALCIAPACTSLPAVPIPEPLPELLAPDDETADGGHGFLGVRGTENDSGSLDSLFFDPGVRVDHVVENSPADSAGIRAGDVLIALDGRELEDPGALDALVRTTPPGTAVELTVRRGDTVLEVPLTLTAAHGGRVTAEPLYRVEPVRTRAGYLTADGGVRVVSMAANSPLEAADIPAGSLITAIDDEQVRSDRELIRRLQARPAGSSVALQRANEGGRATTHRVELLEPPSRVTDFQLLFLYDYESDPDGRQADLSILDLWFFELFQYRRDGVERQWVFLELFGFELFVFGSAHGELGT